MGGKPLSPGASSADLTRVNSVAGGRSDNDHEHCGVACVNITGIVVHVRPPHGAAVREALGRLPGVEVHALANDGRMVVTVERADDAEATATLEAIARVDGVMSTALVYHHDESLPDDDHR